MKLLITAAVLMICTKQSVRPGVESVNMKSESVNQAGANQQNKASFENSEFSGHREDNSRVLQAGSTSHGGASTSGGGKPTDGTSDQGTSSTDSKPENPAPADPPKEDPPKEDPPKEDPPKEDPPKEDPPKEDPPKEDPPKEDPPKEDPPKGDDGEEEEEDDEEDDEEEQDTSNTGGCQIPVISCCGCQKKVDQCKGTAPVDPKDRPKDRTPKSEKLPKKPVPKPGNNGQGMKKGMTWGLNHVLSQWSIAHFHCYALGNGNGHECDAAWGDTPCAQKIPLLCLKPGQMTRPNYPVYCKDHEMPGAFYCGWTGGIWGFVPEVHGLSLTSRAVADKICEDHLGKGYRMAEHHDGYYVKNMGENGACGNSWKRKHAGGYGAYSFIIEEMPKGRYWTAMNGEKANCWDV